MAECVWVGWGVCCWHVAGGRWQVNQQKKAEKNSQQQQAPWGYNTRISEWSIPKRVSVSLDPPRLSSLRFGSVTQCSIRFGTRRSVLGALCYLASFLSALALILFWVRVTRRCLRLASSCNKATTNNSENSLFINRNIHTYMYLEKSHNKKLIKCRVERRKVVETVGKAF